MYDIAIIGGGPAGLTAGIYSARADMKTVMIESLSVMGQLTMTDDIENYPGVKKTGGFDLTSVMKDQAVSFGLACVSGTVDSLGRRQDGEHPVWQIKYGEEKIEALSVIIASGARPRKLGVPGEDKFSGMGISYCATCDGAFFRDKEIMVVGGGNTAIEEALFLTRFAKKVTVIHRRDRLRAAKIVEKRAFANDKMDFIWDSVIEEISGTDKVEKVRIKNVKTDVKRELLLDGVFIFTGWVPNTGFIGNAAELDEKGKIVTDEAMGTRRDGVFACGDCRKRPLNQVITACADGAIAAQSAQLYVEKLKGTAYE
ncbi:MAG: thioredoxin-disulfide reductase [Candidatus Omnitrophica bacterium]|nr:thioredoxin-disulfide reductase [Candidatus Omnitrophota bacterium]MBU1127922.1 thioredoxin-disulfide reductase [Candidatus Omnitrophota bacterium]MBU1784305.1 thioredoxin-disulfide reductase [Candidatus Omnitrophota bacterium]MBU1851605.1 thioredoxin-disulfide reductase [Candidatus Omnitrophota bacterium]